MKRLLFASLVALLLAAPAARAEDEATPRPDPFQEAMRRLGEAHRRMGLSPLDFPGFPESFGAAQHPPPRPRLGVAVRAPDAALADQLDLPQGHGLVIADVAPDSAAAKAGMKKNDILLELGGKAVPREPGEFAKLLAGFEAGKPLDAAVMRKGRKETLGGVTLPEAKPRPGKRTSVTRTGDKFVASQQDGKLSVTVEGVIDGGEAKVQSVTVDEGDGKKAYDAVAEVPEAHRKRVEALATMAAGKGPA